MFRAKVIKTPEGLTVGMPELDVPSRQALTGTESGSEVERKEKEVYEQAYREGERAGYEVGLRKAEVLIEKLKEAVEEVQRYRDQYVDNLESMVFSLSMAVARAVLKEEVVARVELMKYLIKEAIRRMEPTGQITIKLHPVLKDIVDLYGKELAELQETIKVEIDPSLPEPSALVSTQQQEVPLDMDTLVMNLVEELKEELSESETAEVD